VLTPPSAERAANLSFFFTHDLPVVRRYRIDVAALVASAARIVIGCGGDVLESAPHRAVTRALAKLLRAC
jgi:hypothetical protein